MVSCWCKNGAFWRLCNAIFEMRSKIKIFNIFSGFSFFFNLSWHVFNRFNICYRFKLSSKAVCVPQFSFLSKLDSFIHSEGFWRRIQKNMSIYPVFITNSSLKNIYPFEFDWKATRIGENICLSTSRRFYLFWTQPHLYVRLFCNRVGTFAWYFTHISIVIDDTMNFNRLRSLTVDYSHWYIPIAVAMLFDNFFICSAVFRIQIRGLVDKILRD